jgi:hypothetical protein
MRQRNAGVSLSAWRKASRKENCVKWLKLSGAGLAASKRRRSVNVAARKYGISENITVC